MSKIEDGGAAFPAFARWSDGHMKYVETGMTLRDYFAAKAMQGMIACQTIQATEQEFSEQAYAMADAMLRARDQS